MAQATSNLEIVLTARDEMSSTLKKVGGLVAGAFAVSKIVDFGKAAVNAFAQAEAQMAIFENNVKNTAGATKEARQAMLDASAAAVRLGFDDEQAAVAMSRLYQRTGDVNQAIKLNALAMDLARARNIDFATASNLVGQTLTGNGKLLKQYGIDLKDAESPLQALDQLQKQVGNSAEVSAKTWKVQMEALSLSWENIQEKIGGALVTALLPFVTTFSEWLNNPENIKEIDAIIASITTFAKDAMPVAIETLRMWKSGWDSLIDVISNAILLYERMVNLTKNAGNVVGNAGKAVLNSVGIGKRASGGPVMSNTPYIVGEQGPELFVPSGSGAIIPNGGAKGGVGGGGAIINVYMTGQFYTEEQAGEKLGNQIAKILGQQLKLRT